MQRLKEFPHTAMVLTMFLLLFSVLGCAKQPVQQVASSTALTGSSSVNVPPQIHIHQSTEQAASGSNQSRTSPAARPAIVVTEKEQAGEKQTITPQPKANSTQDKIAYLTFDDGPNDTFTPQILDILKEYHVKATFFVIGRNLDRNPDIATRIISEGHALLNHTYSHDYKYIYSSPENLLTDLDKCRTLLENQYNVKSMVFRPPGGPAMLKAPAHQLLAERGYLPVGWNITGADTAPQEVTAEQVFQNVASGLKKVEKMQLAPIILLHDGTQLNNASAIKPHSSAGIYLRNRTSVVQALPRILELLKQKGYSCQVIDEHTPPAWPKKSKRG